MHFSEHYYFRLFLLWPILQFSTQHLYNSVRIVYKLDFNYSSSSQRRCPTAAQENRENYHNRNVALQRLSGAFFFPLSFTLSKVFFSTILPIVGRTQYQENLINFAPFFHFIYLFFSIYLSPFSRSLFLSPLSLLTHGVTHTYSIPYTYITFFSLFFLFRFFLSMSYTPSLSLSSVSPTTTVPLPTYCHYSCRILFQAIFSQHLKKMAHYCIAEDMRVVIRFSNRGEHRCISGITRSTHLMYTVRGHRCCSTHREAPVRTEMSSGGKYIKLWNTFSTVFHYYLVTVWCTILPSW